MEASRNGHRELTMTQKIPSGSTIVVLLLLSFSAVPLNQAQSTTSTTEIIVNPGGTCGKGGGDRGNGICANGKCCSRYGWCGITPAHCSGGQTLAPALSPSSSSGLTATTTNKPATRKPTTKAPTTLTPTTLAPSTFTPTLYPTSRDWSLLTPGHTSFCGPKIVGGYEIAKSTCSFATECGKGMANDTHFGASGNDCPEPYMCFTDIVCLPPTSSPSDMPSGQPSFSAFPTETASDVPSVLPSQSSVPTPRGQTKHPTYMPTVSNYPTYDPTVNPENIVNKMTTRGSFCGESYEIAVNQCSSSTLCSSDEDCSGTNALCFPGISCSLDVDEWNSDEDYNVNALNNGADGPQKMMSWFPVIFFGLYGSFVAMT